MVNINKYIKALSHPTGGQKVICQKVICNISTELL